MADLFNVKNVSISIRRPPQNVYRFASNGENLPRWATGLGQTVRQVGADWILEGPLGRIKVLFAQTNDFGVLDHDVTLESGVTVHNPFRVVPNGLGSIVIFTVFQLPGVSDQKFEQDTGWVEKDLRTLRTLLES